jgi:hypothetical protein
MRLVTAYKGDLPRAGNLHPLASWIDPSRRSWTYSRKRGFITSFDMNNGMPPRCRNRREPTAWDTTTASAAFSLVIPVVICTQNSLSISRRCEGAPGECSAPLPVNCFIHPAGLPLNTPWLKVLRRPAESTQCCSKAFQKALKAYGMKSSMGRKADCWDNAPTESLWGSLKRARVQGKTFKTRDETKAEVMDWLAFYSAIRLHSSLRYTSPMNFEKSWWAAQQR